ncbi:CHAT domain-containing protein, partial [Frankia sp. QA3]|uniref:CHAT domain-containing protein n=1 Tax=Frankia sp. QA3 TaxID=710111 RepID=UPI000269CCC8
QAVAATTPDHPERAGRLSNLGAALQARFDATGAPTDLTAAVDVGRQAVAATAPGHPNRAGRLSNLGAALHIRFTQTGSPDDLDAAVEVGRQAVAATAPDHADRTMYLSNLAIALRARFERTGSPADLTAAIDAGRTGAEAPAAAPRLRAIAARGWGAAAGAGERWAEAAKGFEAAVALVGLVTPRSLARPDQEHLLGELNGLAADAAAACVRAGRVERAVELFEQGRGVLLGQALDIRTDVTELADAHPDLAHRFLRLCEDLDRAGGSAGSPPVVGGLSAPAAAPADGRPRAIVAEEFDAVMVQIRERPGFAGFLRPPPVEQLRKAAGQGPLVMVAVSRFGSCALLLTTEGVDDVPLPLLTPNAVYEQVVEFLDAFGDTARAGGTGEKRLDGILGWLWDALAGPVLDRLGIIGPPARDRGWPRVWWCVSGLLSFLPVHAAGHHDTRRGARPDTVVDRVVSSFTPSIRALLHARRTAVAGPEDGRPEDGRPKDGRPKDGRPKDGRAGRVLAVGMPRTPAMHELPGAQAETEALARRFEDRAVVLTAPRATRDAVMTALRASEWAHFACHGIAEIADPSASRLVLYDRPLSVADLTPLRLERAELAFLSACETARPGGRLADEAIHLASAFQLAGFRHVIATLWLISDSVAVDLADQIYATLAAGGDPASAVHQATRDLRDYLPRRPALWASHIHAGA